ncbi:sodium-coupled monocarboxylate transporter 1-like [Ambystoma mexicanum]|uniref:sodium-coupled monocarboxylate transporter 1-like n=1 Tax=Ambystoma mexicanum TaxID=8296 RepID=UPI0037E88DD2
MGAPGKTASFSIWDYVVFAGMLLISAVIGIYHAFAGAGKTTSKDFLFGGRSLNSVPVALSLTASFMSAITLLGMPAEVYRFGAILIFLTIAYLLTTMFCAETFLPVFYRLGLTSTYEYLELRFNKYVRRIATVLFIIVTVIYTGIAIYSPTLALNQVTGFDLWGAVISTGLVCMFYCALGGLKAVIWTDVFQVGIMVAGLASVIVRTVIVKGGIGPILEDAYHGGRMQLWNVNPDLTQKYTFWTIVIGAAVQWSCVYGVNQTQIQRYNSCKSMFHAKMSLYLNLLGLCVIQAATVFCGLCIYSVYRDCDPWTAQRVSSPDQLLPYLTMDILQDFPGLPGLFVASVFSGTLSTVSSSINALAAVTVEDFIRPFYRSGSERTISHISKLMNLFFGAVCIGMAGLASTLGGLVQATSTVTGILTGPLLGIFMLGIFFSFTNSKGAITGLMVGVSLSFWITIGAYTYPPLKSSSFPLSLSTEGCNISLDTEGNWTSTTSSMVLTTTTSTVSTTLQQAEVTARPAIADYWYSLSYMYFSAFGTLTTIVAGLTVSLLTGGRKQSINPQLFLTKEDSSCSIFSCSWLKHVRKPPSAIGQATSNPAFESFAMKDTEKSGNTDAGLM